MEIFNYILGNNVLRLLFLALLWLISELIIYQIVSKNNTPSTNDQSPKSKDKGSWWLLALGSTILSIIVLLVIYFKWQPSLPTYVIPIGMILILLGISLRMWSVIALGKFFTLHVEIFSNHQIIETGPYRWIRHPSYTGVLLTAVGYGLASGYLVVLLSFVIILGGTLSYRMYVEEKALRDKFGRQWEKHSAKTGLILPKIFKNT